MAPYLKIHMVGRYYVQSFILSTKSAQFGDFCQLSCSTTMIPSNNHMLNLSEQHTYLGVIIHKCLSWTPHSTSIVTKASRILNFLKCNLYNTRKLKKFAYLTIYASDVWDLYHLGDIIQKVQQRAAWWVMNDYGRYTEFCHFNSRTVVMANSKVSP